MHISDVHEYGTNEEAEAIAKPFLDAPHKKALTSEIEEIVNIQFERLEHYAEEFISQTAADRAEKFLERVLKGDEDAAMALLGNKNDSDRYRSCGYDQGKPWSSVIHGRLFETSGIELRRKIVAAHPELLKSERIADLEAVVEGLTQQTAKLQRQVDEMSNY